MKRQEVVLMVEKEEEEEEETEKEEEEKEEKKKTGGGGKGRGRGTRKQGRRGESWRRRAGEVRPLTGTTNRSDPTASGVAPCQHPVPDSHFISRECHIFRSYCRFALGLR